VHFRSPSSTSRSSVDLGSAKPGNDNRESGSLDDRPRRVTIRVLQEFASLCKPAISKQFSSSALPCVAPYCARGGVKSGVRTARSKGRASYLPCNYKGDRRGSNPRPSEPQSVWSCPDLSSCVAVCGLDKEKTRPSKHQFSFCVRSSPMLYCCRIAATLLPLNAGYSPSVSRSSLHRRLL
jgi:hypothetical protein